MFSWQTGFNVNFCSSSVETIWLLVGTVGTQVLKSALSPTNRDIWKACSPIDGQSIQRHPTGTACMGSLCETRSLAIIATTPTSMYFEML